MESTLSASNMQDPSSSPLEKCLSSANGNGDLDSEEGSSLEETGFNWGEYLEETGASAAPHTSFKHVEISIQSNFQPGMKLEVANKNNPDTYWVATIITTCGQLLLLRYCGYGEDRRADFWCDVVIADLHPVGWCTQNNKVLMPPDAIKEKYTDWTEFLIRDLTGSRTAPANLLEGPLRGKGPIDLITVGSLIELQDSQSPFQYWIVSVIENVGGRLRLRYVGLEDTESYDQWLFYLDYRLRPVGWCQENKYRMDPPSEIYPLKMASEWKCTLEKSLIDAAKFPLPMEVFKDHADLRSHFFTVGMKLETVNMSEPFYISPASVTKVFNNHFFQVTIDDLRPEPSKLSVLCHADSLGILPVQWCLKNGVSLTPPKGYSGQDFDWADYHKQHGAQEAPPFCFRNVLSMIINAAYKPGRVLRELQLVEDPHWNFQEETLKAKYRGKTYRAVVKIVRTSDQVANFCRRVCAKLECCPNLFSPVLVSENCPENCSIHTKTKYTYYYGKRKKISKPPIGESNPDSGHPKPARRRKRRKSIFVQKKRRSSAVDLTAGSGEESEEEDAEAMDEDTASEETGSELRDDQTDTSSAEVPSARPRRAVTLRSGSEPACRLPTERTRRGRRAPAVSSAEEGEKCPPAKPEGTEDTKQEEEERLVLESNPLEWTVTDVVRFIKLTDCAPLAKIFQEQDIDGQALLLLTLPTVQECMELKLGPAIKLCHQIERVKVAFYAQYAN
ncbi:PREDICTED: scm-like with four MBT domains protein 2 isoform X2 [Colobus angolensis palliatus]|uniref:scm-like with four MBT domains protein 2 isoform X2 n=1 Tax=Colobus angolensis palliatus TaxID=336983 RepID=UPI0005F38FAD|nr:PREDICTED: scm-like with four MBT domains protein 2 isoform X2 [Colobus angolensis palliatus]